MFVTPPPMDYNSNFPAFNEQMTLGQQLIATNGGMMPVMHIPIQAIPTSMPTTMHQAPIQSVANIQQHHQPPPQTQQQQAQQLQNHQQQIHHANQQIQPAVHSQEEINSFHESENITVSGNNVPTPMFEFGEYPWPRSVIKGFYSLGYLKPTPIQATGWPIALAGRDMVGIARTGSGKTLSYILPAIVHIENRLQQRRGPSPPIKRPFGLVLTPTRELAQQIFEVISTFRNRFASVCVFGGAFKGQQIRDIQRNNPLMVVATPGRLNDLIDSQILDLSDISYLVLDEADRMLDMGFEPQIRKIIAKMPGNGRRQTLMWSATWPKEVRSLAGDFLVDYIQINIGALQLHANHNITQIIDICEEIEKKDKLFRLLSDIMMADKENKTLIFAETKRKVDDLTKLMRDSGFRAMCIHGDKSQSERDWALKEFRSGRWPILVATDVAARGLDVENIKFVINFDYPNTSEDYVHRIGRTGRKDNKGTAYTFFTKANFRQANELVNILREANQDINPQLFDSLRHNHGNNFHNDKYRRYNGSGYGGSNQNYFNRGNNQTFRNSNHYQQNGPVNLTNGTGTNLVNGNGLIFNNYQHYNRSQMNGHRNGLVNGSNGNNNYTNGNGHQRRNFDATNQGIRKPFVNKFNIYNNQQNGMVPGGNGPKPPPMTNGHLSQKMPPGAGGHHTAAAAAAAAMTQFVHQNGVVPTAAAPTPTAPNHYNQFAPWRQHQQQAAPPQMHPITMRAAADFQRIPRYY